MTNNLQAPESYEKIECYKKQKDISNNSTLSFKNLILSKVYGIVSTWLIWTGIAGHKDNWGKDQTFHVHIPAKATDSHMANVDTDCSNHWRCGAYWAGGQPEALVKASTSWDNHGFRELWEYLHRFFRENCEEMGWKRETITAEIGKPAIGKAILLI